VKIVTTLKQTKRAIIANSKVRKAPITEKKPCSHIAPTSFSPLSGNPLDITNTTKNITTKAIAASIIKGIVILQ